MNRYLLNEGGPNVVSVHEHYIGKVCYGYSGHSRYRLAKIVDSLVIAEEWRFKLRWFSTDGDLEEENHWEVANGWLSWQDGETVKWVNE